VRALAVGAAVAERLAGPAPEPWRVAGVVGTAAYLERGGFVIALTAPQVPLMPNGVTLERPPRRWPRAGASVRCAAGAVDLDAEQVRWSASDPPVWDAATPAAAAWADGAQLRRRGQAILRRCGLRPQGRPEALVDAMAAGGLETARDPAGRRGLLDLLTALATHDPRRAAAATPQLLGRGCGLTPEGDDLLCGAAATIARAGADGGELTRWLRELRQRDAHRRSSDLSLTLLELAAHGRVGGAPARGHPGGGRGGVGAGPGAPNTLLISAAER
jgi:hypothetical protein